MSAGQSAARLLSSRFLWNYRSEGRPAARLERVLAIGRAFLTVSGLIAIYVDPTEPARLAELTYAVLFGYSLYSIIVLAFKRRPLSLRWDELRERAKLLEGRYGLEFVRFVEGLKRLNPPMRSIRRS
jgi:hypothetical protein